jgi:hypothetical protein
MRSCVLSPGPNKCSYPKLGKEYDPSIRHIQKVRKNYVSECKGPKKRNPEFRDWEAQTYKLMAQEHRQFQEHTSPGKSCIIKP